MGKVRTTLYMDEDLAKLAKVKAVQEEGSLSNVVEHALRKYLDPAIGVELTSQGTVFISGPTISTMQPNSTAGVPVVGQEYPKNVDNRGVPPLK